jgi:hypothetical protein
MRRIFLSHSTRTQLDETYLLELAEGLRARQFEVFLDRWALGGSDDWSRKIANHLLYCQGAVFLASPDSVASPYVQYEISNLFARWQRESRDLGPNDPVGFPLVPLLRSADVAGPLQTDKFWKAIRFTTVNYLQPKPAADAVAEIAPLFEHLPDPSGLASPLAILEGQIETLLAGATPGLVFGVATAVNLPVALGAELARQVARGLLTRTVAEGYQFIATMGAGLTKEQRQSLFELLAPAWVSGEAARRLSDVRVAIINGAIGSFTPQMYLLRWRQTLPELAGELVEVASMSGAGIDTARLHLEVQRALAERLRLKIAPGQPGFVPVLRKMVTTMVRVAKKEVIVVIPALETDLEVLAAFCADPIYENIRFVIMCPESSELTRERYREPSAAQPVWLKPELAPDQEESAYTEDVVYRMGIYAK